MRAAVDIDLSSSEKIRCLRPLLSEARRRRGRLRYNVRVMVEKLLFEETDSAVGTRRRSSVKSRMMISSTRFSVDRRDVVSAKL